MSRPERVDEWKAGCLPLVISVCGHRTVPESDVPALEHAVRDVLRALREAFPHTPLVVLSSLAEGADRLVARIALQDGAHVVAVLPVPADEYAREFPLPASRDEFHFLWEHAAARHVVPAVDANPSHRYVAVARHLTQRAHVLLALWDGEASRGPGGTATLVHAFRTGTLPPDPAAVDGVPGEQWGLLAWIRTPRGATAAASSVCVWEEVLDGTSQRITGPSACRDARARDVAALNACLANRSAPQVAPGDDILTVRMRAASALADALTRQRTLVHAAVTAALILAVGVFSAWHLLWTPAMWLLPVYAGVIAAALAGEVWVRRRSFEARVWLTRSVSEALRVQTAWCRAGVVNVAADCYPLFAARDIRALRCAVRGAAAECGGDCPGANMEALRAVRESWVAEQADYYGSRAACYQREHRRHDRLWQAMLAVHVLSVAALYWAMTDGPWAAAHSGTHGGVPPYHWGILLIILPLACITLMRQSYLRHGRVAEWRRYRGAADLFARADAALVAALEAEDAARARALIRELGREALAEHAEWLMLHLDRPLEVEPA